MSAQMLQVYETKGFPELAEVEVSISYKSQLVFAEGLQAVFGSSELRQETDGQEVGVDKHPALQADCMLDCNLTRINAC